jgi:hypothetical protein
MQNRIRNHCEDNKKVAQNNGNAQDGKNTKKKYWSSQELESPLSHPGISSLIHGYKRSNCKEKC